MKVDGEDIFDLVGNFYNRHKGYSWQDELVALHFSAEKLNTRDIGQI
jgi:hypothetical protein